MAPTVHPSKRRHARASITPWEMAGCSSNTLAERAKLQPNNASRPVYVPYDINIAPLAGVIQFSPLADIKDDSVPDAVPAATSGVVYPAE